MDDVLIALDTDLASEIAIHYACKLEKFIRFNVQVIHSPDMDEKGHSHGSGWVHQKWENAIVQQAGKDIARLVRKELFYNSIGEPKIIPGERDQVVLEEIRKHRYDFLIEGFLYSFESDRFFQKLDSELYKSVPCPILMVKNLVDPTRGIQIVGTAETIPSILSWFFKLFKEFPGTPDILICHFNTAIKKVIFLENDTAFISCIEDLFSKQGKKPGSIRTAEGSEGDLSLLVRDHALSMSHMMRPHSNLAKMLSLSPCPVMFCPKFQTT